MHLITFSEKRTKGCLADDSADFVQILNPNKSPLYTFENKIHQTRQRRVCSSRYFLRQGLISSGNKLTCRYLISHKEEKKRKFNELGSEYFNLSFDVFFLSFHWPRAHHVTWQNRPLSKCFAANNVLLVRNWNQALVWKWQIGSPGCQRLIWHL